jgi:hypothetical protein
MFLYLLHKAIEDILIIFNDADAPSPADAEQALQMANEKAEPLWKNEETPFPERQAQCQEILRPILELYMKEKPGEFHPVSDLVANGLNQIFKKHYNTPGKFLLIGRTDDQAYQVQDGYAREVAAFLGRNLGGPREARTIIMLRKAYGRGTLPLLCMSSASALWELCQSSFYRRQLFLVSSPGSSCRQSC